MKFGKQIALLCTLVAAISGSAFAVRAEPPPEPIVTYNPVVLPDAGRGKPISLRVTAPMTGDHLPIVVFSHGARYSKDDYSPLTEYWAAHGFVVLQPTHLDSATGGLAADDPRQDDVWQSRISDIKAILNGLNLIEAQAPDLKGRLNRDLIIAAGHSYGGYTVQALIGARIKDPKTGAWLDLSDKRVKAAIILAGPGGGGADLTPQWAQTHAYMDVDWSTMTGPALVVAGTADGSIMTVRGPEWHEDAYRRSPPGDKCLIVLKDAKHYMGGILGVHRTEVADENPARLATVKAATLGYLQTIADPRDPAWVETKARLAAQPDIVASVACK